MSKPILIGVVVVVVVQKLVPKMFGTKESMSNNF